MFTPELITLLITAIAIGFTHTILGPDHYLPFIMMSKARHWSVAKTAWVTLLCGMGHIVGSVVLGLIGVICGVALKQLSWVESIRGELAVWCLITFGLLYFIWGIKRAWHHRDHRHEMNSKSSMTPWALFIIFAFGPCEPLIPLLIYPAAQISGFATFLVIITFGVATVLTMFSAVMIACFGLNFLSLQSLHRYSHAMAGFSIAACGCVIKFLGL